MVVCLACHSPDAPAEAGLGLGQDHVDGIGFGGLHGKLSFLLFCLDHTNFDGKQQ
jgi:hypothetical protein